jgi:hypothetical protein
VKKIAQNPFSAKKSLAYSLEKIHIQKIWATSIILKRLLKTIAQ